MLWIKIQGMEMEVCLGVYAEEKIIPNHIRIDISMKLDKCDAIFSDNLSETLDYQKIYDLIAQKMLENDNLLERKAYKIIKSVFQDFAEVVEIHLQIAKKKPKYMEMCEATVIDLRMERKSIEME
jgi:dihydroneopterin aldolase